MIWRQISIHAPHEGERQHQAYVKPPKKYFNPRSPRGGATIYPDGIKVNGGISIHAPHEGERR